jgi:glycine cleavage system H protein
MASDITVKTKLGEYLVKSDRLYTKTDEWLLLEDSTITVGITDYAQKKLKYIVNVELPEAGQKVKKGEPAATLESVKSVADVYAPVDGEIAEAHEDLIDSPDIINKDPYGGGWIFKIKASGSIDKSEFLTPEQYAEKIKKEET